MGYCPLGKMEDRKRLPAPLEPSRGVVFGGVAMEEDRSEFTLILAPLLLAGGTGVTGWFLVRLAGLFVEGIMQKVMEVVGW